MFRLGRKLLFWGLLATGVVKASNALGISFPFKKEVTKATELVPYNDYLKTVDGLGLSPLEKRAKYYQEIYVPTKQALAKLRGKPINFYVLSFKKWSKDAGLKDIGDTVKGWVVDDEGDFCVNCLK